MLIPSGSTNERSKAQSFHFQCLLYSLYDCIRCELLFWKAQSLAILDFSKLSCWCIGVYELRYKKYQLVFIIFTNSFELSSLYLHHSIFPHFWLVLQLSWFRLIERNMLISKSLYWKLGIWLLASLPFKEKKAHNCFEGVTCWLLQSNDLFDIYICVGCVMLTLRPYHS